MSVRRDTITVEFERDSKRPLGGELCKWLKEELGVTVGDLKSVEQEYGSRRVFLKMKVGDKIDAIVEKNGGQREFVYERGPPAKVFISSAGLGMKVVRVRNLPTEVEDSALSAVLSDFGKVCEITMEKYGSNSAFQGLYTGVRLVRMILQRHVPNYRKVDGVEVYVEYFGNRQTCSICSSFEHLRAGCPQRRRPAGKATYAERLASKNGTATETPVTTVEESNTDPLEEGVKPGQGEGGDVDINEQTKENDEQEEVNFGMRVKLLQEKTAAHIAALQQVQQVQVNNAVVNTETSKLTLNIDTGSSDKTDSDTSAKKRTPGGNVSGIVESWENLWPGSPSASKVTLEATEASSATDAQLEAMTGGTSPVLGDGQQAGKGGKSKRARRAAAKRAAGDAVSPHNKDNSEKKQKNNHNDV